MGIFGACREENSRHAASFSRAGKKTALVIFVSVVRQTTRLNSGRPGVFQQAFSPRSAPFVLLSKL